MLKKKSPQRTSPYTPDPPNETVVGEKFLSKKYKDLIGYLILLHYFEVDEKHYWYLMLDLQEHVETTGEFHWISVLSENKNFFLQWLESQQTISCNAFFGSICKEEVLYDLMNQIVIQFEETFHRPRRLVRRRGYKDKGFLASPSSRIIRSEVKHDAVLIDLQFQIETKRENRQVEKNLFREYLRGDRTLTDEQLLRFRILNLKEIKQTC